MSNPNLPLTPTKKATQEELRFINSPDLSEKDLYEALISYSPKPLFFQLFQSHSSEKSEYEESYSSEMISQDEVNEGQYSVQEKVIKRQFVGTNQIMTPKKQTKGCHCQKSHCQKNYCDCYKMGEVCSKDCSCIGCQNQHITNHHTTVRKALQLTRSGKGGKQPKCNCQKSHCLKDYCQCHSIGRTCSAACNCFECQNKVNGEKTKRRKQPTISNWAETLKNSENVLFN